MVLWKVADLGPRQAVTLLDFNVGEQNNCRKATFSLGSGDHDVTIIAQFVVLQKLWTETLEDKLSCADHTALGTRLSETAVV